jgi:hypothetical protein
MTWSPTETWNQLSPQISILKSLVLATAVAALVAVASSVLLGSVLLGSVLLGSVLVGSVLLGSVTVGAVLASLLELVVLLELQPAANIASAATTTTGVRSFMGFHS